jgi:vancomycin permeability regulator SanA
MKKTIKYTFGILILWFSIHITLIVIDGLRDENIKSDIGVIFGNKVNPDGTLSERLEKRLLKGIELYNDSLVKLIIVSGGLGKEGHFEGTKMYEYLIKNGIPKDRIVIDNYGNTTEVTAHNVKKMNLKIHSLIVISQYYHISRAKLAFRNNGYDNVYGAHANYFEMRDTYSLVREFFGYYKYQFSKH